MKAILCDWLFWVCALPLLAWVLWCLVEELRAWWKARRNLRAWHEAMERRRRQSYRGLFL